MLRRRTMQLLTLIAAVGASGAYAGPLQGVYSSPVGDLRVVETGGVVKGTFAGGVNPCGLAPGAMVLEGTRLDDSVTGSLRVCRIGDGCSGAIDGLVMLMVSKKGAVMSGAVHIEEKQCKTPLAGDGLSLKRSGSKKRASRQATGRTTPVTSMHNAARDLPESSSAVKPLVNAGGGRAKAEALANEAQSLIAAGEIEDARAKLLAAVDADPTYSEAHVGVGVTYYLRDRYDDALEAYKRGLEANPGNRDAYYNIGCVYALKNEPEQALRYLQIAVLNGYVDLKTLDEDPDLRSLAEHPGFQALRAGQL